MDDSKTTRVLVECSLQVMGYEVVGTFSSGIESIEAARRIMPWGVRTLGRRYPAPSEH